MMEEELLRAVEESRVSGKILGALNSIFIALIPRMNEPIFFEDLRPISICNLVYKLISKIVANRLKLILLGVILREQFGFLNQ
jgi:hypothetical protein